jgi:hypothetical protein
LGGHAEKLDFDKTLKKDNFVMKTKIWLREGAAPDKVDVF